MILQSTSETTGKTLRLVPEIFYTLVGKNCTDKCVGGIKQMRGKRVIKNANLLPTL